MTRSLCFSEMLKMFILWEKTPRHRARLQAFFRVAAALPPNISTTGGGCGGGVFLSLLLSLELPCEHPVEKSVEKILGVRANSPQVCDSHAFYIIMLSRCGPLEILLKSSSLLTHLSGSFSFLPCSFTGELVCASWLSWGSPALLGFCATWWSCEVSSLMDSSVMLHFF